MTNKVFIDEFAEKANITKKDAKELVDAFEEAVRSLLGRIEPDEKFKVADLTFSVKDVAARVGVNPSTGEKIEISARRRLVIKPSGSLKDIVN